MATVKEIIVPVIAPKSYVLTLSEREAAVLSLVLSRIGGDNTTSLRQYMTNLSNELNRYHNIRWQTIDSDMLTGSVHFTSDKNEIEQYNKLHHPN